MAFAKNTRTGKFASVPDHYIGHPVFGGDLTVVDPESADKPTKEKKTKIAAAPVAEFEPIQEQEAPETNIEDEEHEDGN
jgi:hypothetical protein